MYLYFKKNVDFFYNFFFVVDFWENIIVYNILIVVESNYLIK